MKKLLYNICCTVVVSIFLQQTSFAATTCSKSVTAGICYSLDTQFIKVTGLNCETTSHFCWGDRDVTECTSCPEGQVLSTTTLSSTNCTNTTTYRTCLPKIETGCGTKCSTCISSWLWSNVSGHPGYQQKRNATCNEDTNCECITDYDYRCAAGYYGLNPQCTTIINVGTNCSGCSACPDIPDKVEYVDESYIITSNAGSTMITQCFIDGRNEENFAADVTGYYTIFGGACYYNNRIIIQ